ncbi:hypothetical protein FRC00_010365 [Tulasnella sp. 408]|nr:hypothetical protein FRC00_010365 [Tulasnella sp. 408]
MSSIKTEKPAKSKSSRPKRSGPESRLKVVVRRLPPNLPEAVFWESVTPWVDAQTTSWKQFCPGKLRPKGVNKENILSRAYIVFNTEEQLRNFHRDYDGHLFRDKSGNESQAVVEYAPFQKVPLAKGKVDQRQGTIQDDEDFKSFIASLSQVEPTEAEKLAMAPPPDINEKMTTPLLASLLPNKDGHAADSRDKRQEARTEEKPAPGKARRRKEKDQAQKDQIDEAEFSRGPVRQDSARPADEQSKKGQTGKERSGGPKNPTKKPSESGDAQSKSKGKGPPSPVRSTRSKAPPAVQQSNDAAGPSTSTADGTTSPTQQKARPKFKFDGILAPGGGRPRGGRSENSNAAAAASSPTTETASTATEAPTPSSRRGRKGKDKEKDPSASSSGPARDRNPTEHSGSKAAGDNLPAKPPAPVVVPRILQRPAARIDDDGATPDSPTPAGLIPVQFPPRGRGRGGGRGRGRGRGRGGAPATES